MDYFKIGKGENTVVRFLHTSTDTMAVSKVHTIPVVVNGQKMTKVIKCNSAFGECPLCTNYPKEEYKKYIHLWDYKDGTERTFSTSNQYIIESIKQSLNDWGAKNVYDLVFKISRADDEFGSYSINVVPATNYPMPTNLEVEIDTDVTFMYGIFRSNAEMQQYLDTGIMPKHTKKEDGGTTFVKKEHPWAKEVINKAPTETTPIVVHTANTSAPLTSPTTFEFGNSTPSSIDDMLPF